MSTASATVVSSMAANRSIPVKDISDKCLPDGKRLLIYRVDFTQLPINYWPWPHNPTQSNLNNVSFPYWVNGGYWSLDWQRVTLQPGGSQIRPLSVTKSLIFTMRHFYSAFGNQGPPTGPAQDDGANGNNVYNTNFLDTCIVANNTTGQAIYIAPNNLPVFQGSATATAGTAVTIYPNRLVTQGAVPFFATETDTFDVFKMMNTSGQVWPLGLLVLMFANFEVAPWWETTMAAWST